jgi:hypothetical protein
MKWAEHAAHMGDMRTAYQILVKKPEGKNHLRDLDIEVKILLKWILQKYGVTSWLDSSGSGYGASDRLLWT